MSPIQQNLLWVALPMPRVRRDPVPATGPGLAGVGASGGAR